MTQRKQYGQRTCTWCNKEFEAHRSNQIYCCGACCKAATNQKIIERYHEKKRSRLDSTRTCKTCDAKLSKYNSADICHACQIAKEDAERIEILRGLGFAYFEE